MLSAYLLAFLCVACIAAGQLLFKISAMASTEAGSFFSRKALLAFMVAIVIYGLTSIGWIFVLRRLDLGKVYPLMALAFIIVPVGSFLVFGERLSLNYWLGVALIFVGVILALRS